VGEAKVVAKINFSLSKFLWNYKTTFKKEDIDHTSI
jgi:hypothetical protein